MEEWAAWKQTKTRGATWSTDKTKTSKEEWLSRENLDVNELADEAFGLGKQKMEDMALEPELKDFFKKQSEEEEAAEEKKNKKKDKFEVMSQVEKADDKDSLRKKLLSFKQELRKDEAFLTTKKSELKKDAGSKDALKFVDGALEELADCQQKVQGAIKGGCKKEPTKVALLKSYQALQKAKKAKKLLPKKKKGDGEDEEED